MRRIFVAFAALIAGMASSGSALGAAQATAAINNTTRTLSQTGFTFEQVSVTPVTLGPGQGADYTFVLSLTVADDGLPATFNPSAVGCSSLHLAICNPPYGESEVAKAAVIPFYRDGRIVPGYIQLSLDQSSSVLETHSDAFAESLTQTFTVHAHIQNTDPLSTYSELYANYIALWVMASPIPEPPIELQLLAGIALVGCRSTLRRRRSFSRSQETSGALSRSASSPSTPVSR